MRVVLDQVGVAIPSGVGRHGLELTRQLIETAPAGYGVAGFVPSSPDIEYRRIEERLPGLAKLHKSALDRRQLAAAWQHGFSRLPGSGIIHAPSLLAPLYRHDRVNNPDDQIIVTVHDVAAWTHPETLSSRGVSWHRAMVRRAHRYADAIIVPTHAVAAELNDILNFGDRIRVIAGAVRGDLQLPDDHDERAERLGLPETFIVVSGAIDRRGGIPQLIQALGRDDAPDLPLVLAGPAAHDPLNLDGLAAEHGLDPERLMAFGELDGADLATVLHRATVAAVPSLADGFGVSVLEAMTLGTPVVHSDAPALVETAGDAGFQVEREPADSYPERLADALRTVIEDGVVRDELAIRGKDRVKAFTWRDSAEKTWQLHADL